MENNIIWLIKIVLAHLISDFGLQKTDWIQHRNQFRIKSKYLYLHILITGITALLLVGFEYWKLIGIITITHFLIDLAKSYSAPNFKNFLLDQFAHLAIIILCWAVNFDLLPSKTELLEFYNHNPFWIYVATIFFLTLPSSIIIGQATKQWHIPPGLRNAGKYIGIIERILICLFVCIGKYEAIGLLLTGKSILRYSPNNEEEKTEYLLVGTLLSIALAIGTGLVLKFCLTL